MSALQVALLYNKKFQIPVISYIKKRFTKLHSTIFKQIEYFIIHILAFLSYNLRTRVLIFFERLFK